jgi:hypothetical protein
MRRFTQGVSISSALAMMLIALASCAIYPAPGPYYYAAPEPYGVYPYRPYHSYHGYYGYHDGPHYWRH